jgi:hypothetical protein
MPPNIEAIKHIGDWKDGKLVCRPDCPSSTHKTAKIEAHWVDDDNVTFYQHMPNKTHTDIEGIVDTIVKNFETHFTEQYNENDWKRLRSVRVQEPLRWLGENIYEALQSQADQYEREKREMVREMYQHACDYPCPDENVHVAEGLKSIAQKYGVDLSE